MRIFSPISQRFFNKLRVRGLRPSGRGFTIIELLVVSVIIVVMTTVVLLQQQKFNSTTLLRSLGYSVALTFRQAQIYGVSVREVSRGSGSFASGYGVYITSADTNHYYLFADVNGDNCRAGDAACSANAGSEDIQTFTIGKGYAISNFCGASGTIQNYDCKTGGVGGTIGSLTVLFKRPNPDAQILSGSGTNYSGGYVQVQSAGGATRGITITVTGQIAVGNVQS